LPEDLEADDFLEPPPDFFAEDFPFPPFLDFSTAGLLPPDGAPPLLEGWGAGIEFDGLGLGLGLGDGVAFGTRTAAAWV
jgi:hypothetical protein